MRKLLLILALLFLCTSAFQSAQAADEGGAASSASTSKILEPSADFSSFTPVEDEEDAYIDESFMYFDSEFNLGIGTGADILSGTLGNTFGNAAPAFNVHGFYFFDQREAIQIGFSHSQFSHSPDAKRTLTDFLALGGLKVNPDLINSFNAGTYSTLGIVKAELIRYELAYKHYWANGMPTVGRKNRTSIWSPNFYSLLELDIYNFGFETRQVTTAGQSIHIDGRYTLPAPSVGLGLDISLRDKQSSLGIEGKVVPVSLIGSLVGIENADVLGNIYSLNASWIFQF